jgi:serine/threonine protein kinase
MHYVIGRGGYGKVYVNKLIFKVWKVNLKKDNKEYAMKENTKALIIAKKSVTSITYERELLCRMSHPYNND